MQQTRRRATRLRRQRLSPRQRLREMHIHLDSSGVRQFAARPLVRGTSHHSRLRSFSQLSCSFPGRHDNGTTIDTFKQKMMACSRQRWIILILFRIEEAFAFIWMYCSGKRIVVMFGIFSLNMMYIFCLARSYNLNCQFFMLKYWISIIINPSIEDLYKVG